MPKPPPIPENVTPADFVKLVESHQLEMARVDKKIEEARHQLETLSALLETEEEQEQTRAWLEKVMRAAE